MPITYTPTTNFGAKDSLPENDPEKVVKGIEFTNEFNAIAAAFQQAIDGSNPDINGAYSLPNYLGEEGEVLTVTNDNTVDWLPSGSDGIDPDEFRKQFKPPYADDATNYFADVYIYVGSDTSAAPAPSQFRQYSGNGGSQDYAAKFTNLDDAFTFITDTELTSCFDAYDFVNSKAQWVVVCAAETINLGNSSPLKNVGDTVAIVSVSDLLDPEVAGADYTYIQSIQFEACSSVRIGSCWINIQSFEAKHSHVWEWWGDSSLTDPTYIQRADFVNSTGYFNRDETRFGQLGDLNQGGTYPIAGTILTLYNSQVVAIEIKAHQVLLYESSILYAFSCGIGDDGYIRVTENSKAWFDSLLFNEGQRSGQIWKASADNGGSLRWSSCGSSWGGTTNEPIVVSCGGSHTYDCSMGIIESPDGVLGAERKYDWSSGEASWNWAQNGERFELRTTGDGDWDVSASGGTVTVNGQEVGSSVSDQYIKFSGQGTIPTTTNGATRAICIGGNSSISAPATETVVLGHGAAGLQQFSTIIGSNSRGYFNSSVLGSNINAGAGLASYNVGIGNSFTCPDMSVWMRGTNSALPAVGKDSLNMIWGNASRHQGTLSNAANTGFVFGDNGSTFTANPSSGYYKFAKGTGGNQVVLTETGSNNWDISSALGTVTINGQAVGGSSAPTTNQTVTVGTGGDVADFAAMVDYLHAMATEGTDTTDTVVERPSVTVTLLEDISVGAATTKITSIPYKVIFTGGFSFTGTGQLWFWDCSDVILDDVTMACSVVQARRSYLEARANSDFSSSTMLEAYDGRVQTIGTGVKTFSEIYGYDAHLRFQGPINCIDYAYFDQNTYVVLQGTADFPGGFGLDGFSVCEHLGNPVTDTFSTADLEMYQGSSFQSRSPLTCNNLYMYQDCTAFFQGTITIGPTGFIDVYDNSTMKCGNIVGSLDYISLYHGGNFVMSGGLLASIGYIECYAGHMSFIAPQATTFTGFGGVESYDNGYIYFNADVTCNALYATGTVVIGGDLNITGSGGGQGLDIQMGSDLKVSGSLTAAKAFLFYSNILAGAVSLSNTTYGSNSANSIRCYTYSGPTVPEIKVETN